MIKVRVGIPLTGGKLVSAAREANYPVLFSANAFFTGYGKTHPRVGEFQKFKQIDLEQFAGLDAALDSAGFVAMRKVWRLPLVARGLFGSRAGLSMGLVRIHGLVL